jgi:hypothetical protein
MSTRQTPRAAYILRVVASLAIRGLLIDRAAVLTRPSPFITPVVFQVAFSSLPRLSVSNKN